MTKKKKTCADLRLRVANSVVDVRAGKYRVTIKIHSSLQIFFVQFLDVLERNYFKDMFLRPGFIPYHQSDYVA